MRIWLVRHGQTAYNIGRRFLGVTDIPLDAEGERQAALLGARFAAARPVRVYSSPLTRAVQTAQAIGGGRLILQNALMEMHMGALEGRTREEVEAESPGLLRGWFEDPAAFECPGGERLGQVQARIALQFRMICHQERKIRGDRRRGEPPLKEREIAVVSHQLAITALLCDLEGVPLSGFRRFSHANTGVTLLECDRQGVRVISVNDQSHLSPAPEERTGDQAASGSSEARSGTERA